VKWAWSKQACWGAINIYGPPAMRQTDAESNTADWEFELATMGFAEDSWHLKTHR
jgi:hypothetical protein